MRDYGWLEGVNLVIERRQQATRPDRLADLASELVQLNPNVIVVSGATAADAVHRATNTIPIVMTNSSDPVAIGLVDSLGRPGGNVTGLSEMAPQLSGKRIELLRQTVPWAEQIAVLWNPGNPSSALSYTETEVAAQKLGVALQSVDVRRFAEYVREFDHQTSGRAEALIQLPDPSFGISSLGQQVSAFVKSSRMPAMGLRRGWVENGGLMAYGVSFAGLYRRAAYYVDRILKGTKPADLPVEQPMTFEFVVNLKTARELGITFPHEILLQVTEVIQ
jgi:putative ABC transport system substrate-binding protein